MIHIYPHEMFTFFRSTSKCTDVPLLNDHDHVILSVPVPCNAGPIDSSKSRSYSSCQTVPLKYHLYEYPQKMPFWTTR